MSAKSAARSGADSRSPGGYGTYNRGEGPLDDPDYSLSVSDLNSNMANSHLISATRGTTLTYSFRLMRNCSSLDDNCLHLWNMFNKVAFFTGRLTE